jgi:hypothetical protein
MLVFATCMLCRQNYMSSNNYMPSSAPFPSYLDTNFDFNSDGQFSQNSHTELPNLLRHPCVMDLYRQNQALQSSQIKLQETQSKLADFAEKSLTLQDKNQALQLQLQSLQSELSASELKVQTLSTELQTLQVTQVNL